jgi:transcription elongation factor Elf1
MKQNHALRRISMELPKFTPAIHHTIDPNKKQNSLSTAFNCPYCGAYASQQWGVPYYQSNISSFSSSRPGLEISICQHCHKLCIWFAKKLRECISMDSSSP